MSTCVWTTLFFFVSSLKWTDVFGSRQSSAEGLQSHFVLSQSFFYSHCWPYPGSIFRWCIPTVQGIPHCCHKCCNSVSEKQGLYLSTVRPRDTRPQAARTLQVHVFELGPKIFELNEFM